ncbi:hypothetical protein IWZ00DRAFT_369390 [Phyllosticta capitalensis]
MMAPPTPTAGDMCVSSDCRPGLVIFASSASSADRQSVSHHNNASWISIPRLFVSRFAFLLGIHPSVVRRLAAAAIHQRQTRGIRRETRRDETRRALGRPPVRPTEPTNKSKDLTRRPARRVSTTSTTTPTPPPPQNIKMTWEFLSPILTPTALATVEKNPGVLVILIVVLIGLVALVGLAYLIHWRTEVNNGTWPGPVPVVSRVLLERRKRREKAMARGGGARGGGKR